MQLGPGLSLEKGQHFHWLTFAVTPGRAGTLTEGFVSVDCPQGQIPREMLHSLPAPMTHRGWGPWVSPKEWWGFPGTCPMAPPSHPLAASPCVAPNRCYRHECSSQGCTASGWRGSKHCIPAWVLGPVRVLGAILGSDPLEGQPSNSLLGLQKAPVWPW